MRYASYFSTACVQPGANFAHKRAWKCPRSQVGDYPGHRHRRRSRHEAIAEHQPLSLPPATGGSVAAFRRRLAHCRVITCVTN